MTHTKEYDNITKAHTNECLWKGGTMKRVGIVMDDLLHKELKHHAVNQDKTVTEIIVELVRKELETKKEQSR